MFYTLFDILTIGFPFCVFKITAGLHFNQWWLVALGGIDLIINLFNFISMITIKKKLFNTCLLSFLCYRFISSAPADKNNWQELGESLDVALAFIIVAYVIGSGEIVLFDSSLVVYWNWAVVLNVLGAGSARLISSIQKIKRA